MLQYDLNHVRRQDGKFTLEPTREKFEQASTARIRFINSKPPQQRVIASEVLWNLALLDGKTEDVRYKSYYEVMAKAPKKAI